MASNEKDIRQLLKENGGSLTPEQILGLSTIQFSEFRKMILTSENQRLDKLAEKGAGDE